MRSSRNLAMASLVSLMVACGGGSDVDDLPPELRLSITPGTVVARHNQSVAVRVDMASVADSDLPSGYAIDLDEVVGRIDVTTAPCPSGAGSRSCQDWTITPAIAAVPGRYEVNVRSVGSRAGTAAGSFTLVVVADPAPSHGAAVAVAYKAGQVLVLNDAGRVFAQGRNDYAEVRSGYQRLAFPNGDSFGIVEPRVVDEFIETKLPAGRWTGIAAGVGSSFAIREDGSLWAWGYNKGDLLGLMSLAAGEPFVDEPLQIPGLVDVRALSAGYDGGSRFVPIALLADGRVRRWHERSGLLPYCEVVAPSGDACDLELTGVAAVAGAAQDAVFLKGDGAVWRAPFRPCDAGNCPPDRDSYVSRIGRVERMAGGLPPAVAVASDLAVGFALAADGTVWRWQREGGADSAAPLEGLVDVVAVSSNYAGATAALALKRDGTVWTLQNPPRQVTGLSNVVVIADGHAITGDCGSVGGAVWRIDASSASAERLVGFGERLAGGSPCSSPPTRTVTVSVEGEGRVVSTPAGIDCPDACEATFPLDARVFLNEAPARDWTVALARVPGAGEDQPDWGGDAACAPTFVVRAHTTCSLRFVPGGDRRLVVSIVGEGRVTSDPPGIDCGRDCVQSFAFETVVGLVVAPGLGYRFGDFEGNGDCADGQMTMDAVKSCIARFVALPAPAAPTGFAATPQAFQVQLRWDAVNGPVIRYTLERATGSGTFAQIAVLDGTEGAFIDGSVEPGTTYQYRLTAHNVGGASPSVSVTTTTPIPGPSLLSVTVNGNGSVASEPAGIDCGADCSESYAYGTQVRLVPTPAAGQNFAGFGGDADCSDAMVRITRPIACVATFVPRSGSGWQQLGTALTQHSRLAPAFSLALDDNVFGAPTVAYVEALPPAEPARLYVKRLDGVVWTLLGGGALNAGSITSASDPSLATRLGGAPHVAWSQGNGTQQNVFVARFNGSGWESVGPAGIPLNYVAGSRAVRPSLTLDTGGLPQVAWIEDGAVKWKRFDGANWVASTLAGEGPVSANADRVRLGTASNVPVIAWTEGAVNDRRLKVVHGHSFAPLAQQVNAPFNVPVTITHFGLRPEDGGAIVMWTQDERPFSVFARRWDGSVWTDYGAPPVGIDTNQLLSFAMARRSADVAFSLQPPATAAFVSLFQRSAGQWLAPPASLMPGVPLRSIEVEFPRSDEPIVAGIFANNAELLELRVYRYFP